MNKSEIIFCKVWFDSREALTQKTYNCIYLQVMKYYNIINLNTIPKTIVIQHKITFMKTDMRSLLIIIT